MTYFWFWIAVGAAVLYAAMRVLIEILANARAAQPITPLEDLRDDPWDTPRQLRATEKNTAEVGALMARLTWRQTTPAQGSTPAIEYFEDTETGQIWSRRLKRGLRGESMVLTPVPLIPTGKVAGTDASSEAAEPGPQTQL